jgi:starch synthase
VYNLASQGIFWHYDMPLTSLGWEYFNPDSIEFYGDINLLKAGLVYADMIAFPSPACCLQSLTPEYGYRLDGVLLSRRHHTRAVLGGVNPERWSPDKAPGIPAPYSVHDPGGKQTCIKALRQSLGLPVSPRPLLALIGPLGAKKELEILDGCMRDIFALNLDIAVLDSMDRTAQAMLTEYQRHYPERLGLSTNMEPAAIRGFLAGSDMLLINSHIAGEQNLHLCAQLYGTVPIALNAGVSADSIVRHERNRPGTGFLFDRPDKAGLLEALNQAVSFWHIPEQWQAIMRRGMEQDFSWAHTAQGYEELYQQAISHQQEI